MGGPAGVVPGKQLGAGHGMVGQGQGIVNPTAAGGGGCQQVPDE
jgi:hypothetical protein